MSEHEPLPVDLREIEARLASLSPAPAELSRDRLMYAAGQAAAGASVSAGRPSSASAGAWKRAAWALAAGVVIATTVAVHAYTTRPRVVEKIVYAHQLDEASGSKTVTNHGRPRSSSAAGAASQLVRRDALPDVNRRALQPWRDEPDYLYQRNLVLRDGVDALPSRSPGSGASAPAPTVRELMEELMPPARLDGQAPI